MGIEPTLPAWEADILPLNYTRMVIHITTCNYSIVHNFYHIIFVTMFAIVHISLLLVLFIFNYNVTSIYLIKIFLT